MIKRLLYQKEFDQIFIGNYTRLYNYALHLTNDSEWSRDIVSDIFSQIWENFSSINKATLHSYLTTLVRNRCVDYLRHRNVINQYSEVYLREVQLFYSDSTDIDDIDRLVKEMLDQLPRVTRHILEQCYLYQKKYAEVAQMMNISPNTVKKHISKAFKILREKFKNENNPGEIPDSYSQTYNK